MQCELASFVYGLVHSYVVNLKVEVTNTFFFKGALNWIEKKFSAAFAYMFIYLTSVISLIRMLY